MKVIGNFIPNSWRKLTYSQFDPMQNKNTIIDKRNTFSYKFIEMLST